ncbi:MAG: OmpA family protein [Prevotella sp.]|nr:OmpA family protein [Prevotella sp.]
MKKLFMVLAFAGVSVASMAQDDAVNRYSVATNSFWSNWFIQIGANWNAFYTDEEHGVRGDLDLSNSPFEKERSSIGAAVAIGKWFTPGIGLRTKLQGIWGNMPYQWQREQVEGRFVRYWTLSEDVLLNLSNMLLGYNPNRVWNFIPFFGGGISRNMTDNFYAMHLRVGLLNEFRLSKRVALNLEIGWNRHEEDFSGMWGNTLKNAHNGRGWEDKDNTVYGELGFTFNLGKATWDPVPDVDAIKRMYQAQIDALNSQLNDANAEIARLNNLIKNHKCPTCPDVHEFITTPVSVFFNLNRTEIASQKDLVNVRALAKYAVDNNSNLLVTGYADSATGSVDHNQWLSERRAETVAGELEGMGVSSSKITTRGLGGVDTLSPIEFNRRATVQITE